MPAGELIFRPDVEDGRSPAAQAVKQLIARYGIEPVASPEIARHHSRDFSAVAFAEAAEGSEQTHHFVAGEPVVDALAVASALYERSSAQKLQMSGCIGEGEARAGCQILDAALALPEMFEQFQPMRMGERVGDLGETCENQLFRTHA